MPSTAAFWYMLIFTLKKMLNITNIVSFMKLFKNTFIQLIRLAQVLNVTDASRCMLAMIINIDEFNVFFIIFVTVYYELCFTSSMLGFFLDRTTLYAIVIIFVTRFIINSLDLLFVPGLTVALVTNFPDNNTFCMVGRNISLKTAME